MITVTFTNSQFDSISAFLQLIEVRSREPTHNKKTNININSISTLLQKDCKSVKIALQNLNKKIKEIK